MKLNSLITAGAVLALTACAHPGKQSHLQAPANYQAALYAKAGAEITAELSDKRGPANTENWQVETLRARLGDLNKVKPGKFEVYVFPKMQTMTHKEVGSSEVILGKPKVHDVSLLAVTSCQFLIQQNGFAKYSPARYFKSDLAKDKKNTCAIIEVTSRDLKNLNRSLLRQGDVLTKRLYVDDKYNIYGLESDFYSKEAKQSEGNIQTAGMKFTPGSHATSGLDFLPVDLPSLTALDKIESASTSGVFASKGQRTDLTFKNQGLLVDSVALRQISRLNKSYRAPNCSLRRLAYKDHYRKPVEMYWCEGQPWPQVVNSQQFVAVTQNISVR